MLGLSFCETDAWDSEHMVAGQRDKQLGRTSVRAIGPISAYAVGNIEFCSDSLQLRVIHVAVAP